MDQGYRALLPRQTSQPSAQDMRSTGNTGRRTSKLINHGLQRQIIQKLTPIATPQCDGKRPSCTHCEKHGTECVYTTDAGETRFSAFKRKYNSLEEELDAWRQLFAYIQSRPQTEAPSIKARLQMCYDPAEAIHLFTTECDSLGDVDSFMAAETPQQCQDFNAPRSLLKIDPALTQNAIQVQAYPWTDVASDQVVSEIISQFILDDRPLALPVVDVQKLVEEMKGCDPASATCCSPLLVNAICAQQCYLSAEAFTWSIPRHQMGQRFLDESYSLLRNSHGPVNLAMAQAVNLLYQAELAKDIFHIAVASQDHDA
ncbi:hypothetical protein ED733_002188 [Metarhizium rileyi]|uniref:Zn(2)-C6 fungal-type domain-containing protein n=1 Tax=Metarhizium rileyi (strain RCEF 4871) TaxID=1649241 RepID=A0A5C6G4Y6_METRR|nr:hypothetical protein ED733_002188 [Metarhizium rileyi]